MGSVKCLAPSFDFPSAQVLPRGDYSPHICESDPCAFKFFFSVKPLEYAEEFIRIVHIKTDAVVPYREYEFLFAA